KSGEQYAVESQDRRRGTNQDARGSIRRQGHAVVGAGTRRWTLSSDFQNIMKYQWRMGCLPGAAPAPTWLAIGDGRLFAHARVRVQLTTAHTVPASHHNR